MENGSSRKCSVCRCEARQICGGCGDVYYCSKEHQKQHWSTHKLHCKPYKILVNDQFGRYLVASRSLKPGDIIFREKALAKGPKQGTLPVCLSCYVRISKINDPFRCTGCNFPFCSEACTQSSVHREECEVLSRAKKRVNIVDYTKAHPVYECITPLRCLLLKDNRPKDYEVFQTMQTHIEDRRGSDLWRVNQNNVVQFLRRVCEMDQLFSDEDIHSVCGAMDTNAFEIKPDSCDAVIGMFPMTAVMAHCCIPNVSHTIDEQDRVTVRAALSIQKGENLYVSYTHTLQGTMERRATLRQSKFFECNCTRCADPTECQTYLSAFKCQKCSVGNVLALKPLQQHTNWRCDRCSYRLNAAVVARIDNQLKNEFDAIGPNDVQMFEDFMKRHSSLLHPNHYYFTSAKHSLSQLYGRDSRFLLDTLSSSQLERKITLCQQLLSVADVVEPGLTRLRGVTLYEMHAPIMMLATRQLDAKEITQQEFKERALQVRRLLEECKQILSMEPPNSSHGEMSRASQTALEQMQQWTNID